MPPTCDRQWCIRQITRDARSPREAERRKIKLLVLPTIEAIELLNQNPKDTNAILHVTC